MLVRCLYASQPASKVDDALLNGILEQSRKNNPSIGVTGLLCVSASHFIQVIEGGRSEVAGILTSIMRDPRHTNVQILVYEEILERRFANWTMGQVNPDKLNPTLLLKYFTRPEIDPFSVSGAATLALLSDLVSAGAIVRHPAP